MHLTCVVGARPNFMKMAPIIKEAQKRKITCSLVHTGQHYDEKMSKLFFEELDLPMPDIYLGVGSGSHAVQTGKVMILFDEVLQNGKTDAVVVVGDVNSTLACALVAVKMGIPVAHVEAGLRSGDRTMPEEINRILTDQISDFLFITEKDARNHLIAENIPNEKIFFVGNVMIDTLLQQREKADKLSVLDHFNLHPKKYAVCTLHRPSNVDNIKSAINTVDSILKVSNKIMTVLPIHPRTQHNLVQFNLYDQLSQNENLILTEPLGYLEFLNLMDNARFVFTDSGGIQEETTVLGVPCLTFRENTERPITLTHGTNTLIGTDSRKVSHYVEECLSISNLKQSIPELWDGHAAERIMDVLLKHLI